MLYSIYISSRAYDELMNDFYATVPRAYVDVKM